MTFKQWILKVAGYEKYGYLATEIEGDQTFPDTQNYLEMFNYLVENDAGEIAQSLFKEAWIEYASSQLNVLLSMDN